MATDRGRNFLRALGERPERLWPDAIIHHGFRIVLLLGLTFLVRLVFPVASLPDLPQYELGQVPVEDVIALDRFTIPKSDATLAQERDAAAAAVAPVFRYDPSAADTMLARVRRFIGHVDSAAALGTTPAEQREHVRSLLASYGFPVNAEAVDLLVLPRNRIMLRQSLEETIRRELPAGIVSSSDYDDSPAPQWLIVRNDTERLVPRDSVNMQRVLYTRAADYLPPNAPAGLADFQRLAVILFFEGSIKLDAEATATARNEARVNVPAIEGEVLAGERVIAAHEPIREREMERLEAYRQFLQSPDAPGAGTHHWPQEIGTFMLNLLILAVFGALLWFYHRAIYENSRHIVIIAVLVGILIAAAGTMGTAAPVELVPIAFPVLVVAILWDGRLALALALVLAALLGVQDPFMGMSARVLFVLGGSTAALSVRVVHRRSQGLVLGAVIAGAYALACIGLGLLRGGEAGALFNNVMWGAANGVACALIAMGFMPVFEAFTRITTDQTLLELADLNRPLLKRLSLEAPGTYAHSINVANLAEAAARAIDANALLVRVGAYYHDIGKVLTPQYFVENQVRGRNPHDQIDPRRSAQIVRSHVVEGLKLAEQAKVPDSVRMFIPEHHGTQTIGFFYDQARQAQPDEELDPTDFSYHGPRPQTRETAILMLADSVESATKVLQEPTPERIRALVDRIVDSKTSQGQLDDAPLTLREITRIKEQFTAVLAGMYHHRIDYPATREVAAATPSARAE